LSVTTIGRVPVVAILQLVGGGIDGDFSGNMGEESAMKKMTDLFVEFGEEGLEDLKATVTSREDGSLLLGIRVVGEGKA